MAFELGQNYCSALAEYVSEGTGRTLERARKLGFEALEHGLDSSAIAAAHLGSLRPEHGADREVVEARRQEFLLAALSPFSVTRHHHEQVNAELEQANRDLRERGRQLESANAELEAFNSSVSHDLRGSLQAIVGFSQTLSVRYRPELTEQAVRLLDLIVESVYGMSELLDDLLNFSSVNRVPLELEPVDIAELAHEATEELEPQLESRTLDLKYGDLPVVRGDRVLLKRVLVNLIANAIKFTRCKPEARIEVDSVQRDGERVIFVRDNGVGFDMEHAGRLFLAFERLHRGGDYEGTGIGLALVERIVVRHGGRVWAESEPGKGATFFFTLQPVEAMVGKASEQ